MAKILIIDDNSQTTKLLEGMVKLNGHQASSINNSTEAVEAVSTVVPDLILLDIMMPKINGIQLCKMLKATPGLKDIPVIIVSALNDIGSKKDAFHAGARDFLSKPFMQKDLIAKINALLQPA